MIHKTCPSHLSVLRKHHHNHFNQLYKKIFVNSTSHSTDEKPYYFVHEQSIKKPLIRVATFDMDGTLTVPVIDFAKMRLLTGISAPIDVLDHIHSLNDEEEKKRLFDIIHRVESEANDKLEFQPYLFETLDELKKLQLDEKSPLKHFAIVTRNSQSTLQLFIEKLGSNYSDFYTILHGREYLPYKPNPQCLTRIAEELNVPIENMIMIGDSFHDIVCAKKAGALSCLYTQETDWDDKHTECVEKYEPDFICHDLRHLIDIVQHVE
ncbi:predicted protein [Naegleria gruberi]|uniref:Predicted protein n=1 Tax=Naegleria gruberi TaxID=5762 RepID=D2VQZ3_NAEGR|nr:uncharacterized protein NAEGRDRAFT_71399 [Naegleria gruberi]EFC40797.1 predicted protein [Naegleria gruberi]|eukprot:XP_002673541.1 predicted protein [Naegleria gruberi strain NEG-M]